MQGKQTALVVGVHSLAAAYPESTGQVGEQLKNVLDVSNASFLPFYANGIFGTTLKLSFLSLYQQLRLSFRL